MNIIDIFGEPKMYFSEEQISILKNVERRFDAVLEIPVPFVGDWFNPTTKEIKKLYEYLYDVHVKCFEIRTREERNLIINREIEQNIKRDVGFETLFLHIIYLSKNLQILKNTAPKKMESISINFLEVVALLHDFSKFVFIGPLPIWTLNYLMFEVFFKKLFPTFPIMVW